MSKGQVVTAGELGGRTVTVKDVIKKDPVALVIPIRDDIDAMEGITLGFRATMFDMKTEDGFGGSMESGGGFGSEWISMEWNGRRAAVRGSELLRAWVEMFAPEDAARFPDGLDIKVARAVPDDLAQDVRDALAGDSNDAEHDALVALAEHFGIEEAPKS